MAPTHVLVSFCNVTPGSPVLATVDLAMHRVAVLEVPERLSGFGGVTGLAVSGAHLYALTSRSRAVGRAGREPPGPSVLLIFDRRDLRLLTEYVCTEVFDGHSICPGEGGLYVVSTGTDAVVHLEMESGAIQSERVHWRPLPDAPRADLHHLNGISRWRGHLVVSGFGRRDGAAWSSAWDGFLMDVVTGEKLVSGVGHPHSVADIGGELAYCQSAAMRVTSVGGAREQRLPGYARGLCRIGDMILAGTSCGRRVSKSTGLLTNLGDAGDAKDGRCAIAQLDAATLAIQHVIDLEPYGREIYDLLPVEDVEQWPIAGELAWREAAIRGLRESFDERDATISWLHTEVAERDRTVSWLHQEVAQRDEAVQWLHAEVAERDRRIAELEQE